MGPPGHLHVLTDRFAVADAALRAGAPVVQVRVKDGGDRTVLDLVRRVQAVAATTGATVLVDDRVDVALAAGADGVHVGVDDLPVAACRRLLGAGAVVGASARDPERARVCEAAGASYLGVGPAHPTTTKAGLPPPFGPAGVAVVAAAVAIPVVAVGGVTPARVAPLLAAGASGVAVVSGIGAAADPGAATEAYLAALDREGVR